MDNDPRDELWEVSFETYYDAYFQEIVTDRLIDIWQRVDVGTRALVALTASGSAVSGWVLWMEPHFHVIWVIVAGAAAVLAILHTAVGVSGHLKDLEEQQRRLSGLRTDLDTFRGRMRINRNFSAAEFSAEFEKFRRRYSDAVQLLKNDLLETRKFDTRCQAELNKRLQDIIEEPAKR